MNLTSDEFQSETTQWKHRHQERRSPAQSDEMWNQTSRIEISIGKCCKQVSTAHTRGMNSGAIISNKPTFPSTPSSAIVNETPSVHWDFIEISLRFANQIRNQHGSGRHWPLPPIWQSTVANYPSQPEEPMKRSVPSSNSKQSDGNTQKLTMPQSICNPLFGSIQNWRLDLYLYYIWMILMAYIP